MGKGTESDGKEFPNGNLPIWARILFLYGIPGFIALYLVYQGTQGFGATLTTIRDDLRVHMSETGFYMRQICVNTAKDDAARAGCYPPQIGKP
jgi:hypothetical protein